MELSWQLTVWFRDLPAELRLFTNSDGLDPGFANFLTGEATVVFKIWQKRGNRAAADGWIVLLGLFMLI